MIRFPRALSVLTAAALSLAWGLPLALQAQTPAAPAPAAPEAVPAAPAPSVPAAPAPSVPAAPVPAAEAAAAEAAPVAEVPVWKIDGVHSSLVFRVTHAGVTPFYGVFRDFSGEIAFDAARPEAARVDVEVKADSIDTRQPDRDKHLRNPDFFNAKQFPSVQFRGVGLKPSGKPGRYTLSGEMTLLGVTQPVEARVRYLGEGKNNKGATVMAFEARFRFRRSAFGMNYSVGKGLGDEIDVTMAVEAIAK